MNEFVCLTHLYNKLLLSLMSYHMVIGCVFLYPSKARKTGILRHFLGHNLFGEETYDIINFGGMGRVTSFGMDGSIHWQVG